MEKAPGPKMEKAPGPKTAPTPGPSPASGRGEPEKTPEKTAGAFSDFLLPSLVPTGEGLGVGAIPMRLLMTADTVGGVWTYALDLARALAPYQVSVALATMGRFPTPAQRAEAAAVPGLTLHPSAFALEWMADPWDEVARAGDWLRGLEADVQPDIVHLNGYAHGGLPWRAPVLMAGHSCVLSWWQAVHGEDAPPAWSRYQEEVRRGLGAANLVAAPTRAMLDALDAHYGPFAASQVIPNGRDFSAFAPGKKQPVIFSAGRLWDEAKNIGALAEAAPGLPWPVCVAGEIAPPAPNSGGAGSDPGEASANPLPAPPELGAGGASGLHFLGPLPPPEIAGWLARAAIYALPARYEPFGLSALEAGLSGCALVLGDIPSLREVWGEAALFIPPDDPDALRRALCRLIQDAGLREEMARRARTRARTYTPERMASGYLAAYHSLLQEKSACA